MKVRGSRETRARRGFSETSWGFSRHRKETMIYEAIEAHGFMTIFMISPWVYKHMILWLFMKPMVYDLAFHIKGL